MFIIGKVLAALVLPPGIFVLLGIAGAALAIKGKRRAAAWISGTNAILIYALSTGLAASLLIAPLENAYPPIGGMAGAKAIVVLGGGFNGMAPERGGAGSLTPTSTQRASYAFELSREYGLPLVFSGGAAYDSPGSGSEAEAAGRLWRSYGVPADRITLEIESRDTRENASGVAAMAGNGPFVLVTSAFHMPRAVLSFERAGIAVIPAPTDYRAKRSRFTFTDFMPGAEKLEDSRMSLHEYIGLAYYRLTM
jgi:uncharacterized SAM-binding protein YcdF (DUF218 family)